MTGTFYVITLNCGVRRAPTDAIERALAGHDWLRFSVDAYFVYAHLSGPIPLYNAIKAVLHPEDLVLVTEVAPDNRYGWVSQVAIEWFQRTRT